MTTLLDRTADDADNGAAMDTLSTGIGGALLAKALP